MWYMVHISNYANLGKMRDSVIYTLVNYDTFEVLNLKEKDTIQMISNGMQIGNLALENKMLRCTMGNFTNYINKEITVLKAIYKNRKLVGYAVSDWIGRICNMPMDKIDFLAKRFNISNGVYVRRNNGSYIKAKNGSFEKIDIKDIRYTTDEIEEMKHNLKTNIIL